MIVLIVTKRPSSSMIMVSLMPLSKTKNLMNFSIHITKFILTFLLLYLTISAFGQTTLGIEKDISFPDLKVEISDDISFPDIKVKIGIDVSFEDLTVGFTNSKSKADFIISTSSFPDKKILYGKTVSFKDIQICASETISFPDVTIEIRNSGWVDYLIYSDKNYISKEEIVICLIEVIKKRLEMN
jgi:hypothetical protein